MHANPDLIRLLEAMASASLYQSQRPILNAAIDELKTWRATRDTRDPIPSVPISMFDFQGRALGIHAIPLDVLRAAYRVNAYLSEQPTMTALAGVTLHKVNKG